MCWWLLGRIGVRRLATGLAGRSCSASRPRSCGSRPAAASGTRATSIATILTFACLIELWGRQRALLIGLLAGAAFLTRAPLAFAIPFYALMLTAPVPRPDRGRRRRGARSRGAPWLLLAARRAARRSSCSSPTTRSASGPARVRLRARDAAAVPRGAARAGAVLARPRPDEPRLLPAPPADGRSRTSRSSSPDGLGMSVLLTSPGLLFAIRADWRATARLAAARRGGRRPHPDPPLLRRRLAPVRLPLLPRLDAVRHRPVRAGRGAAGRHRSGLARPDRLRRRRRAMGVYWAYNNL